MSAPWNIDIWQGATLGYNGSGYVVRIGAVGLLVDNYALSNFCTTIGFFKPSIAKDDGEVDGSHVCATSIHSFERPNILNYIGCQFFLPIMWPYNKRDIPKALFAKE